MKWTGLSRMRVLLAAAIATARSLASEPLELPPFGSLVDPVNCAADPAQSYALYVPSQYTADRHWPVVYCFDPVARGRIPVERLRAAAERYGYILVGSNNSRNGPIAPSIAAANALLVDTQRRLAIDPARIYVAGFSGGARAAMAMADAGKFAGVLACSGGFPGPTLPSAVPFVVFGTAGRRDFNFAEMIRLGPELDHRGIPRRIVIFEGAHDWLPESTAAEALAWFDLQAIRRGLLPREEAVVQQQFADRVVRIPAMTAPADETAGAWRSVLADFADLVDTTPAAKQLAMIEKTREFRRANAARERAIRDEESWRNELLGALRGSDEREAWASPFGEVSAVEAVSPAEHTADDPDAERRSAASWQPFRSRVPLYEPEKGFGAFRRIAADVRRRSAKDAAAARALGGVFAWCIQDGATLFDAGKFEAASRAFEAATLLRPESGWAYFEWARARAAVGDRKRARELLEAATAKGFSDQTRITSLRQSLGLLPPVTPSVPPLDAVAERGPGRSDDFGVRPTARKSAVPRTEANSRFVAEEESHAVVTRPGVSAPRDPDVVSLAAVRVAGHPIGSFGVSLKIFAVPETRQISRVLVYDVVPNTEAERSRIHVGDEIVRVNGRSIYSFVVGFDRNSDFGRLFVGPRQGDQITLDVVTPDGSERRVTLTEGGDSRPPWLR